VVPGDVPAVLESSLDGGLSRAKFGLSVEEMPSALSAPPSAA
jgi:hypothetical protein